MTVWDSGKYLMGDDPAVESPVPLLRDRAYQEAGTCQFFKTS